MTNVNKPKDANAIHIASEMLVRAMGFDNNTLEFITKVTTLDSIKQINFYPSIEHRKWRIDLGFSFALDSNNYKHFDRLLQKKFGEYELVGITNNEEINFPTGNTHPPEKIASYKIRDKIYEEGVYAVFADLKAFENTSPRFQSHRELIKINGLNQDIYVSPI